MKRKLPLILIGLIVGLAGAEIFARLYRGRPPELDCSRGDRSSVYWQYVEIYEPFFAVDAASSRYVLRRSCIPYDSGFSVRKAANEKRVFILGESVAERYDTGVLKDKLSSAAPGFDWQVVNCGVGGYDSHRIRLIAEEIVRYEPDLVVLMMGNNEGCFNPVSINWWIYRHQLLARSWVVRTLSGFICRPRYLEGPEINEGFRSNVEFIAGLAGKKGIPLAVCTLPQMRYAVRNDDIFSREIFPAWWLLGRRPERVPAMLAGREENRQFAWLFAASYERRAMRARAEEFFDKGNAPEVEERRAILRNTAERFPGVILVDFSRTAEKLLRSIPEKDFFWDEVHYWNPAYQFLSDEIIETVRRYDELRGTGTLAPMPRRDSAKYRRTPVDRMAAANAALRRTLVVGSSGGHHRHLVAKIFLEAPLPRAIEYCAGLFEANPGSIDVILDALDGEPDDGSRLDDIRIFRDEIGDGEMHWARKLDMSRAYCIVGEVLREHGRSGEALRCFDKAVALGPDNFAGYFFRGLCRYDAGRQDQAAQDFDTAAKLRPDLGWLNVELLDLLKNQSGAKRNNR